MRTQLYLRGLSLGYLSVAANVLYTAASVPMALYFLGKEQFGVWAIAQQMAGYLVLFEIGASSAASRLIANFKDDPNSPEYRNIFVSCSMLFMGMGLIILLVGLFFAALAPDLLRLPLDKHSDFKKVFFLLSLSTALTISLRFLSAPLWAFQRMDILNWGSIIFLCLSLFSLPLLFLAGQGLASLPLSLFPGIIASYILCYYSCRRGGYYPSWRHTFCFRFSFIRQTLSFGTNILFLNLGTQLASSAALLCAARTLSLSEVATLAIGLKVMNLCQNLFQKLMQNASPGLTEIFVRGDISHFVQRFRQILFLSAFMAIFGALFLVAVNSAFVSVWTGGRVHFPNFANLFLGALLCLSSVSFCFFETYPIRGDIKPVRFLKLYEGALSIGLCLVGGYWGGMAGLLFGAFLASAFSVLRIIRQLKLNSLGSLVPAGTVGLAFLFSGICAILIQVFPETFWGWFAKGIAVGLCLAAIWRILIPPDFSSEIKSRLRRRLLLGKA